MGYDDAVRDRGSTEHSNEKDIVHCAKGVYFIMILCWLQSPVAVGSPHGADVFLGAERAAACHVVAAATAVPRGPE
ncbi:unnamed protein product [Gadus morhua 'NCC']